MSRRLQSDLVLFYHRADAATSVKRLFPANSESVRISDMTRHSKTALAQLDAAAAAEKLSPGAVENIRTWLTEPYLAEYAPQVAEHLAAGKWKELDDVFWTIIPFGTGGRRGRMYPIGTNAINDRTIGESAQGLADYVKEAVARQAAGLRHRLRHAAPLARVRRAVCRDHGRGRLQGLLPRRLPQHARTVVRRALQAVRLRHHGHGQPQSAARQRGEGLLVHRRAAPAAARRAAASSACTSVTRIERMPFDEGAGVGPDRLLPGGGRRGVRRGGASRRARPARAT